MIGPLLLIAANVRTDAADAANAAYVQCLFATSREAHAAQLPVDAFQQRLSTACSAEQRAFESTAAKVLVERGESNPAGKAKSLAEQARQQVINDYRRALELEPQLRNIAEMCRAHPEECRQ